MSHTGVIHEQPSDGDYCGFTLYFPSISYNSKSNPRDGLRVILTGLKKIQNPYTRVTIKSTEDTRDFMLEKVSEVPRGVNGKEKD